MPDCRGVRTSCGSLILRVNSSEPALRGTNAGAEPHEASWTARGYESLGMLTDRGGKGGIGICIGIEGAKRSIPRAPAPSCQSRRRNRRPALAACSAPSSGAWQ